MKNSQKDFRAVILVLCSGVLLPAEVNATEEDGLYLGIGLGVSRLNPETSGTTYSVTDDSSSGGKIYLGYDLNHSFSIEGYYSNLGRAEMSPAGNISYKDIGINATYYFYVPDETREGLSMFLRGGIGRMINDTSLPYRRVNGEHLMFGAGAEYGLGDGWGLRANFDFYDKDAELLTVSLLKRFGSKSQPMVIKEKNEPRPTPEALPVSEPVSAPVVVAVLDTDGDGVMDDIDKCLNTPRGNKVDVTGCNIELIFDLKGVVFATNSNKLIGPSHSILNAAAESLSRYPDLYIAVAGHTDDRGKASYNKQLSERRAHAVRDYLISKGVSADHLTANGYGEERPVADNNTKEGRSINRRVELAIIKE